MSTLEVDKIIPQSGTATQLGESGDTITIPAGATITNNGTATGFGSADTEKVKVSANDTTAGFLNGKLVAGTNISLTEGTDGGNETLTVASTAAGTALTGSTNNTIPTVTGANALAGEANLTFDGTVLKNASGILRLQNATTGTADTDGLLIEASGNDVYINNKENADMYFRTNNTDRLKLHENGVMSAANGIALGVGTANTSSNVLDDYEEGLFTPSFTNGAGLDAVSYATNGQKGAYTLIGNTVFFTIRLAVSSATKNGNRLEISGLPFTSFNGVFEGGSFFSYVNIKFSSTTNQNILQYISSNNTTIQFYKTDGTNFTGSNINDEDGLDIYITGTYRKT